MSIFKEANELAIHQVVDAPGAPTSSIPTDALPLLKTAQDLLDWITADLTLNGPDKSNARSAIFALARVTHSSLDAIPLDERHLLDICYRAIRADKSVKPKRRAANRQTGRCIISPSMAPRRLRRLADCRIRLRTAAS